MLSKGRSMNGLHSRMFVAISLMNIIPSPFSKEEGLELVLNLFQDEGLPYIISPQYICFQLIA